MLLLDEPTNDLDVDTLRALEDGLESFPGCAVVISHDRWFLDRIATHILAFEGDSQVRWFEGNFTEYEAFRHKELGAEADQPAPHQVQAARRAGSATCHVDRARSARLVLVVFVRRHRRDDRRRRSPTTTASPSRSASSPPVAALGLILVTSVVPTEAHPRPRATGPVRDAIGPGRPGRWPTTSAPTLESRIQVERSRGRRRRDATSATWSARPCRLGREAPDAAVPNERDRPPKPARPLRRQSATTPRSTRVASTIAACSAGRRRPASAPARARQRRLVGIVDAGEAGDLAGPRLGVEALRDRAARTARSACRRTPRRTRGRPPRAPARARVAAGPVGADQRDERRRRRRRRRAGRPRRPGARSRRGRPR